jgi:DNA-binding CsgD family transcriptional regulator
MPGQYEIPAIPKPSQPTGGPKPPSIPNQPAQLALEPEFQNAYSTWKSNPSPESNDMMLKSLQPIIDNAVKTYAGDTNPIIRSKAKKIVVDTLPGYDPSGSKLKTYLFNQLQGLKRFSMQQGQIISVPEQVQLDYSNLSKREKELTEELGREPSTEELADASNLSLKRINYVRGLKAPMSEGFVSRPAPNSDGSDYGEPAVVGSGKRDATAWHDFVYSSVGPTDKLIMEHSLGLYGKGVLSNEQIARKLGVSPAAVSIRKNKIQQELDKRYTLNIL